MENLALKDEQIRRQSEEIESLNRKVESLEKELRKCLDPDSGTINPAIRYHYKTGKGALLQQIQQIDCLDEGKFIYDRNIYDRLFNVVAGVLLPATGKDEYGNFELWFNFRQELLDSPECSRFFSYAAFREMIASMNNFICDLEKRDVKNMFSLLSSSAECLLSSPNPEGWGLALEALNVLEQKTPPEGRFNELDQYDIQNLRFSIQIIRKCAMIAESADRDNEQTSVEGREPVTKE